jgi:ubiquinone/menaquinone biosynthesis C-methylase UbiE
MEQKTDVCGMDHVKWLDNGFRMAVHNPDRLFGSYVRPGGVALDVGCGPGAFTVGLARLTGKTGKVIAVDVQEEMLVLARKKAAAAGVADRVEFHRCADSALGIETKVDFILTFYMVHESPQPLRLVDELSGLLKPGGFWFLAEPKFHVTKKAYRDILDYSEKRGLRVIKETGVISRVAVLAK